jgi:hypothetical protein
MNSSARGPFLAPGFPKRLHWTSVLTSRLNRKVKLVGSTISCEGMCACFIQRLSRSPKQKFTRWLCLSWPLQSIFVAL